MVGNPILYREAHEVEQIAGDLIHDYHPDLKMARIKYVFRSEPAERRGKPLPGHTKRIGGLNAWLTGKDRGYDHSAPEPFFVIEVAEPIWKRLDDKTKRALIDHLLTRCDIDLDTNKYSLRAPDVEDFTSVVRRHGLWHIDLENFVKASQERLPLFETIEEESKLRN